MDEDLVKKVKQFRLRKETNNAAIISEYSLSLSLVMCFVDGGIQQNLLARTELPMMQLCDVCSKVFVSSLALGPVVSDRCCGNMLSTDLHNERKNRESNMILDGKSRTESVDIWGTNTAGGVAVSVALV